MVRGVGLLATEAVGKQVGGDGFNFWTNGGHVFADSEHEGITHDGDPTVFHPGIDAHWRDGLIGIAIARSNGDMDLNNTDTLKTTATSAHPCLVRKLNNPRPWTTIGHTPN